MNDNEDYELHKTPAESPVEVSRSTRTIGLRIVVALLVLGVGAAVYVLVGRSPSTPTAPVASEAAPPATASQALDTRAEAITIPPLNDSDPVVRQLVEALSRNPVVAAWLTNDNLIRNFVDVVVNIADGESPARDLKALGPASPFLIAADDRDTIIDPRSYDRYAPVASAVASIDAAGTARLYATLKPRLEGAYSEVGTPQGTIDRTLERAIGVLLRTPVLDDPIRVRPKGNGYAYVDERLEALAPAQKQLLRMGPRIVRVIEEKLRAIARAVGIRSD